MEATPATVTEERRFRALVCRWYSHQTFLYRKVHVDRDAIRFSIGLGRTHVYGRQNVASIAQHHWTPGWTPDASTLAPSVSGVVVLEVQLTDGGFGRYCLKPLNLEEAVEVLAQFGWPIKIGFLPRMKPY
ncbi:MAG: hypothetical protein WCC60_20665 [Ilumatobacteraceae bacterium]